MSSEPQKKKSKKKEVKKIEEDLEKAGKKAKKEAVKVEKEVAKAERKVKKEAEKGIGRQPKETLQRPAGKVPEAMVVARRATGMITRPGRGFSLRELSGAGLAPGLAARWGVRIDGRRRSTLDGNITLLKGWGSHPGPVRRAEGEVKRVEADIKKVGREVEKEAGKVEKEVAKAEREVKKEAVKAEKAVKAKVEKPKARPKKKEEE